ncbi:MAG: VanZ family protein [Saprospiraceae bacterium]|nr:VanZ family protein [Saprospiraceae bacterium]
MSLFKNKKEQSYWIGAGLVVLTIYASLFLSHSAQMYFLSQDFQAVLFLSGMFLVSASVLRYGSRRNLKHLNTALILCGTTILVMVIFRLGAPERSHLMEYTILTLLIHLALSERFNVSLSNVKVSILAFLISGSIGLLDELIQIVMPERVFDVYDIIFNFMAAGFAVGMILIIQFVRRHIIKP